MVFDPIVAMVVIFVVMVIAACVFAASNAYNQGDSRPNKTVTMYSPGGEVIKTYTVSEVSSSANQVDLTVPETGLRVSLVNSIVVIEDQDHFPLNGPKPTHRVRLYGAGKEPIREFDATQIGTMWNNGTSTFVDVKTHCFVTVLGSVEIEQLPRTANAAA